MYGYQPRHMFMGFAALAALQAIKIAPEPIDTNRPPRRLTGKTYPHSSTRQRARYVRQIAAGQIKNA